MASYQVLNRQGITPLEKFSSGLGRGISGLFTEKDDKIDPDKRQEKINAYIESLGDEYETEVKGFDEFGDPELLPKKKKEVSTTSKDPKKAIQEALLFDEGLPELGAKIGLKQKAQGFPLAGGGGVLPGPSGGDFDPSQLQTIQTPDYGNLVKSALLERSQPGVAPEQARKNVFGFAEDEKPGMPGDFQSQVADIFASGEKVEDPRAELKKLIPLYADNKEALDRLKLLISLYPEI